MKRLLYLVMALIITATGAACSESVSPVSEQTAPDGDGYASESTIAYGRADGMPSTRMWDSDELQTEFARLRASILEILRSDAPTSTRDRRVRAILLETEDFELSHYVRQFAAVHVLRELLSDSPPSAIDAIDYYATLLVENASPEAPLILEALQRLRKRWTPERLAEASRLTAERGIAWVERVCRECSASKTPDGVPDYDKGRVARKVDAISRAADKLAKMASP